MNLPVIYENYQAILENVPSEATCDAPTLLLGGGKSNYIKASDMDMVQDYFPNSHLEIVANAGHWVHAEKPKQLLALVQNFLIL